MTTVIDEYFVKKPNWRSSYYFRKTWRTSIQNTLKNGEKRTALFTWPRRTIKYNIDTLNYAETISLKQKMYRSLHKIWGVPYWQDKTVLTTQANSGQAVLNIESTEYRNFEIGAQCILLVSEDSYEVGDIESMTSNEIVLKSNLSNTWDLGTEVYPILKGRTNVTQEIRAVSDTVSKSVVEFREEYDELSRYVPDISNFPTYREYPVFNLERDWGRSITVDLVHDIYYQSFLGKSISLSYWDETAFRFKGEYMMRGRPEIWDIVEFFDSNMGRWGTFWLSSGVSDVKISEVFDSGDSQIVVQSDGGFPEFWLGTRAASHLVLSWPDGTYVYRGVISASGNIIIFNNSIGKSCSAAELDGLKISFIVLCRFDQDELEIEYKTDEVVLTKLVSRSVLLEVPGATTTTTTSSTTSTTSTTV